MLDHIAVKRKLLGAKMKSLNKHLVAKYHRLNRLRLQNKLSDSELKEFTNLCSMLLDQLLVNNADVMKRLKVADVNLYNLQQK